MKVGIIAGYGSLPRIAAENLIAKGYDVTVIALDEEVTENFSSVACPVCKISVTQLGKILKTFKEINIEKVLFAGKVNKTVLFSTLKFDLTSVVLLAKLSSRKDDTIMEAICRLFEENGIAIMPQTEALDCLYVKKGVLGKARPDKNQLEDVEFGLKTARELGRLDIGQTVVVKNKAVMALEAIEGTDKAIIRGCQLAGKDAVAVKCAKPGQDLRFDIPTVGVDTLKNLADNKGKVLAVEAEKTFVVNLDLCIKYADEHKIIFMAI